MLLHWLWLAERPGLKDTVKNALVRAFLDPEALFYSKIEDLRQAQIPGLTEEMAQSLLDKDLTSAGKILENCMERQVSVLTMGDPRYPERLRVLGDMPVVLYYKGTVPDFDHTPTVALVGTRRASAYGLRTARRLGAEIAQGGGLVVSGLADGIDSEAMWGALQADGRVTGVLGCGADVVYPRKNRELFSQTERQGCILSQYAPGTPPLKWNFLERNRIISGLSCGTAVIEAPEKSGALSTARHARRQGREVFAVPGNVEDPRFAGSNRLLREGAIAIGCGRDLLAEYEGMFAPREPREHSVQESVIPEKIPANPIPKKKLTPKAIDKAAKPLYSDQGPSSPALSEEEHRVVEAIGPGERLVDEVIAQVPFPAGKTLSILTMLELRGIVARDSGKRVSRKR